MCRPYFERCIVTRIITTKSGLRVWVKPMSGTRSVALGVFVGAGCIYESEENSGIAHFIEHMVFKGTTKRTAFQISEEMESKGIQLNAYTAKGNTAYYTIAIDEYAELCFEMLSDLYFNATFTEENMEKEKGVVIEEIGMSEDDPEDVCMELLTTAHFGEHPAANSILGTADTVKSLNKEKITDFMNKYYTAENTVISVVGNITEEDAVRYVEKYFVFDGSRLKTTLPKMPDAVPNCRAISKYKDLEQANIGISFPQFSYFHPLSAAGGLVSNMIGGGMSSRLFQRLREEMGLVYSVYATDYQYSSCGDSVVFLATSPSTAGAAVRAVREVILEIKEKGLDKKELEKSKAQYKAASILAAEGSSFLMRAGGRRAILMDEAYDLDKRIAEIDAVTEDMVKEIIDTVYDFNKASLSYVGKEPSINLLKVLRGEDE